MKKRDFFNHIENASDSSEALIAPAAPPPAVFLHSAFRSGSTWMWNRFRQASRVCAYYEPFNEALASLDADGIAKALPTRWATGHPALDAPYFAEYAPLLRRTGGVARFDARFACEDYFADAPDGRRRRYLAGLIAHARKAGRLPVLGFCRSFGRLAWMRRHLAGLHIATWRNPWDQWASVHEQTVDRKNAYFEFKAFQLAAVGAGSAEAGAFFADLHLPPVLRYRVGADDEPLMAFFYALHVDRRFRIFLRMFMFDMLMGLAYADLVVDLDGLSADATYRQAVGRHLREATGLADLSFDDCALPRHAYRDDGAYLGEMDAALAFLDGFAAGLPAASPLGPAAAALKSRMAPCRQAIAAAAGLAPDAAPAAAGDIDRLALCHLLFAAGLAGEAGLAYLQDAYGADFRAQRADLGRLARVILGLDGASVQGVDRAAVERLAALLEGAPETLT